MTDWPDLALEQAYTTDPLSDSPSFTDITQYARLVDTSRGRSFELDYVDPGTFSSTLKNGDGRFDPLNTGGDYYPNLTVNRRTRFSATWDATTYILWDGFADSYQQVVPDQANPTTYREAILLATDATKMLTKNYLSPVGPFTVGDADYGLVDSARVGGQLIFPTESETGGSRAGTILDLWPFPASMRDLDDGLTALSRDGTPQTGRHLDPNETALSYLRKIRDSEEGRLHVSADGKVTFWARDHWQSTDSQLNSQITLADDGTGDASYFDIVIDPADDRYVKNVISRNRHFDAGPIMAQSPSSTAAYGTIPDSREVISQDRGVMLSQCQWLLAKYSVASVRISQIVIKPRRNPDVLWPQVLGRELGDRITVKRSGFSAEYWIEQIAHSVQAVDRDWTTTWQLAPVDTDVF